MSIIFANSFHGSWHIHNTCMNACVCVKELFQPTKAIEDYTKAVQYLEGDDGYKADPNELPAAR